MYYRLKNDKFCGFYENNNEDGTFIEISQTDWNDVLNKQSLGEVIFYNKKTILSGKKILQDLLQGKFPIIACNKIIKKNLNIRF